ncbi:ABC transporter permease [Propionibacteriaceae bacterium Y2011]|uniref:ABC transporter permease n=1 Tax=Microlunatus sp. Y2014 TaxID=3418488 RepID=UPI003B4B306D
MAGNIIKRLLRLVVSILAVSMITFGLLQTVPGSFGELANMNIGLGLDQTAGGPQDGNNAGSGGEAPAWLQYLGFMQSLVTGDLPYTYKYPQLTIGDVIAQGFPITATLAVLAIILTLALAIPIGLMAAVWKDSLFDRILMTLTTALTAMPGYLFVLVLVLIFALGLGWLPTGGWEGPIYLVIPVTAMALEGVASQARYVRSSVLEQLREDYVTAALAKGGTQRIVMVQHVLRNSLIPLVTVAGPYFAQLLTGTVFIEALLRIPGLGLYFATAAQSRDMPLLMGSTLFFAILLVTMNMLVDLSYRVLDPRVRYSSPAASIRSRRARAATFKKEAARA